MIDVTPGTILVFSDIACPWAGVDADDPSVYDDLFRRAVS